MFFITINSTLAYTQKVIIPKVYHIENVNNTAIISSNIENIKVYDSPNLKLDVKSYSSISAPKNESLSYTITNATITVSKKFIEGITKDSSVKFSHIMIKPDKKIINGTRLA